MKVGIAKMTIEELDRLPDDGNRYELVDGELYVTAAPRVRHQAALVRLVAALYSFVQDRRLGAVFFAPVDVYLDPDTQTRVEPDLLFVARDRQDIIKEDAVYGPPDLVAEILSESTQRADLFDKRDLYQRSGVKEYWIVNPDARWVMVYRFAKSAEGRTHIPGETLTTPLLPGLAIDLTELFAGL